jgi:hypothetical protein
MARIALVPVSFFAMSCNAWAWGDEGHKIVCEIAMRLAVPSQLAPGFCELHAVAALEL